MKNNCPQEGHNTQIGPTLLAGVMGSWWARLLLLLLLLLTVDGAATTCLMIQVT
jgi:hypothetical protein